MRSASSRLTCLQEDGDAQGKESDGGGADSADPTDMSIFEQSEEKGKALAKILKQVCSRNKAMEKKELWKAKDVQDRGNATTISLKSNTGEVTTTTRLPKGAMVTVNEVNRYEEERAKNANMKEDVNLSRFCDGKDNAWRPDAFFTETCGESDVPPWPIRPTEIFTNPALCMKIMNHQMERRKKRKLEKKHKKAERELEERQARHEKKAERKRKKGVEHDRGSKKQKKQKSTKSKKKKKKEKKKDKKASRKKEKRKNKKDKRKGNGKEKGQCRGDSKSSSSDASVGERSASGSLGDATGPSGASKLTAVVGAAGSGLANSSMTGSSSDEGKSFDGGSSGAASATDVSSSAEEPSDGS